MPLFAAKGNPELIIVDPTVFSSPASTSTPTPTPPPSSLSSLFPPSTATALSLATSSISSPPLSLSSVQDSSFIFSPQPFFLGDPFDIFHLSSSSSTSLSTSTTSAVSPIPPPTSSIPAPLVGQDDGHSQKTLSSSCRLKATEFASSSNSTTSSASTASSSSSSSSSASSLLLSSSSSLSSEPHPLDSWTAEFFDFSAVFLEQETNPPSDGSAAGNSDQLSPSSSSSPSPSPSSLSSSSQDLVLPLEEGQPPLKGEEDHSDNFIRGGDLPFYRPLKRLFSQDPFAFHSSHVDLDSRSEEDPHTVVDIDSSESPISLPSPPSSVPVCPPPAKKRKTTTAASSSKPTPTPTRTSTPPVVCDDLGEPDDENDPLSDDMEDEFEDDENDEDCENDEDNEQGGGDDAATEGCGWVRPRRPRPGLSLTVEEIEMVLNCYTYFSQSKNKKESCQIVGKVLKIGARKVFELTKEREMLVKRGADASCIPIPKNKKRRGKPRERVLDDTHLFLLRTLLQRGYNGSGQTFPKVSKLQEFLKKLPPRGQPVADVPGCTSPGPLDCNIKTLKGHLTKLRKEVAGN